MSAEVHGDAPPGFVRLEMGGPFIAANGPLYQARDSAPPRLGLRVCERHVNPMGNLHGGMMASFCDMLLPFAAFHENAALRGFFLPTVSLQIDYLVPARQGAWLQGSAQLLRSTRSLVFMQGLVTADGEPCARASGVFKIGPAIAGAVSPFAG